MTSLLQISKCSNLMFSQIMPLICPNVFSHVETWYPLACEGLFQFLPKSLFKWHAVVHFWSFNLMASFGLTTITEWQLMTIFRSHRKAIWWQIIIHHIYPFKRHWKYPTQRVGGPHDSPHQWLGILPETGRRIITLLLPNNSSSVIFTGDFPSLQQPWVRYNGSDSPWG